jgi:glucose-1-phosphate thymidylyltransferase
VAELVGVIPAAGKGSRLAPYPGPKELFPIGWQPYAVDGQVHRRPKVVSQYVVEGMVAADADALYIVVGERKFDLVRYYGDGRRFGTRIAYLFQEEPEGMVHAVDLAYPWIRQATVLLGMPDTVFYPPDALRRLVGVHAERNADLTLGLFATTRPWKFGMVDLDGSGRVHRHMDKPAHTHLTLMWGLAVWGPEFTELLHETRTSWTPSPQRGELVLGDVFDAALKAGLRVFGHHFENGWYVDIGTCDEIVEAQRLVGALSQGIGDASPGVRRGK